MNLFAGKQKAWMGAVGTFFATLILQITTGQPIDLSVPTAALAQLAADTAASAVFAAVTYALAYLKPNVAADGTPMHFVKPSGTVVDAKGDPIGSVSLHSHWLGGVLAIGGMLLLAGCDPNQPIADQAPDFAGMTPNQLCVSGMSLAAATKAIAAAAETKEVDLLDTPVAIGNAICATIAAMGSPSTLR